MGAWAEAGRAQRNSTGSGGAGVWATESAVGAGVEGVEEVWRTERVFWYWDPGTCLWICRVNGNDGAIVYERLRRQSATGIAFASSGETSDEKTCARDKTCVSAREKTYVSALAKISASGPEKTHASSLATACSTFPVGPPGACHSGQTNATCSPPHRSQNRRAQTSCSSVSAAHPRQTPPTHSASATVVACPHHTQASVSVSAYCSSATATGPASTACDSPQA